MVKRTRLLRETDQQTTDLETRRELQDRLTINVDNLDEEIIAQPSLYHRAASHSAKVNADRDSLKDELRTLEAQTNLDVRIKLEKQGIKITEAIVSNEVRSDMAIIRMNQKLLEKSKEADLAQALRETFIQRSHCLRDLVNLTTCGWMQSSTLERGTGESGYQAAKKRLADERKKGV